MFQTKKTIILCFSVLTVLSVASLIWKFSPVSGTTNSEEYKQQMRDALVEAGLATSNNLTAIDASADNLANFIYSRSGVQLSQTNKNTLKQLEEKSWAQSKRITQECLTDALTQVAFEKLVILSDADIDSITTSLMGFDAPDLPVYYKNGRNHVMLRFTGEGIMSPEYFKDQIKNARSNAIACQSICTGQPSFSNKMTRSALRNKISNEILSLMTRLGDADTNFSSGNTNDMTVAEAVLVSYAVITNDTMAGNTSKLQQEMTSVQTLRNQGSGYPSPQNHKPFGSNGYLYGSPANQLLNDASTSRLLELVKEGGDIQGN